MEKFHQVFVFSPPHHENEDQSKEAPEKPIERLILKPFSSIPHLDFTDVTIGSTKTEKFEIINPSNKDATVIFVTPPDFGKRGFFLNPPSTVVLKNSSFIGELKWKPIDSGTWNDSIQVKVIENSRYIGKISVNSKSVSLQKKKLGKRNASTFVVPKVQSNQDVRRETYELPTSEAKFKWQSPKSELGMIAEASIVDATTNKTFTKPDSTSLLEMSLGVEDSLLSKTVNIDNNKKFDFIQAIETMSFEPKSTANADVKAQEALELSRISNDETPQKKRCLMSIENTPPMYSSTPLVSQISVRDKENFLVPNPVSKKLNFSQAPSISINFGAKCPSYDDFLANYGITTISNPFIKNAIYPMKWVEQYSKELIKWLNSVLMPHKEFTAVNTNLDLPALWKKVVASDKILLAPTKEVEASNYHKDEQHLLALRKGAQKFYNSKPMIEVLKAVHIKVEKGYFEIKDELDLCVDQGVRFKMVQLIMYYNPLWLRIGLETIFNQPIEASSKNLAGVLVLFLKNNFLTNKSIVAKNLYTNTKCRMPTFRKEMNDYITFKFLSLIFFLDQAKVNHLIPYDPCLFNKSSPIKESELMFTEFIKEFVKCVSNMKRTMSYMGYTFLYKQTPFHEFDFAVKDHLDLRDGVRLAKSMEIILKNKTLCNTLLMPAISRLQKVHNVKITLDALLEQGFVIEDVTAYDIVNGHREKTMSLLWQILHKFLAPRYEASAQKIQLWWREKSLFRIIKSRIEKKRQEKLSKMATLIQSCWRGFYVRKHLKTIIETLKEEKKKRDIVIKIQQIYRANVMMRNERAQYLKMRNAALNIQRWYRASTLLIKDRTQFLKIRKSAVLMQQRYRATLLMRKQSADYQQKRNSIVCIQQWYRTTKLTRQLTSDYQKLRTSVIIIQQKYLAIRAMRIQRAEYQRTRKAALCIQQWYRSTKLTSQLRSDYLELRKSAITIQHKYRALKAMKMQRAEYLRTRNGAIHIQQWYRACSLMKTEFARYKKIKSSAILIQRRYLATLLMRKQSAEYKLKRNSVVRIQQWYRATKLTRQLALEYQQLRTSVITIQQKYRAIKAMRKQRDDYQRTKIAAIYIQQWYRTTKLTSQLRSDYLELRKSAITIQHKYRALKAMRMQRAEYLRTRNAAIHIQQWYKASSLMKTEFAQYQKVKSSAIIIQQRHRATLLMRKQLADYRLKRNSIVRIQQWYRATKLMRKETETYQKLRKSAIVVQRQYRATTAMKIQQAEFQKLKSSAIRIQQWYRATKLTRQLLSEYKKLRTFVVIIQRRYRAIKAMRLQREEYQRMRNAAVHIQQWYRACSLTKIEFAQYQRMKSSALIIQQRYRATILMRKQLADYQLKKTSIICIQQWYRATKLMKRQSQTYRKLRASTIIIQQRYRAVKAMKIQQEEYRGLRNAALHIQQWYRTTKLTRQLRSDYQELRKSVISIQQKYRAIKAMRIQRDEYQRVRNAAIHIQQWYRASKLMREQRSKYQLIKNSAVRIQLWLKATKKMQVESSYYNQLKASVKIIQKRYRKKCVIREAVAEYQRLKDLKQLRESAASKIQRWYRCWKQISAQTSVTVIAYRLFVSNQNKNATLAAKFPKIIATLRKSNHITVVVDETSRLDNVVRHSPKLALEVVKLPDVNKILFHHLAVQCRSEPYQNIFKSILGIFINIALNKEAVSYLWQSIESVDGLTTIISTMTKYYKSNVEIFCKAVTLLWILGQNEELSMLISRNENVCRRLKFLKSKVPQSDVKHQKLPDLRANYGYGRNWSNEFQHPYFAIKNLLCILKI